MSSTLRPNVSIFWEANQMTIPNETLQAMIRSYYGFELTDEELDLVRPELDNYLKEVEQLRKEVRELKGQKGKQTLPERVSR